MPVVVGALLAAGGGLFGAWIQSRREHRKWLNEKRYDAYVQAVDIASTVRGVATEVVTSVNALKDGTLAPEDVEPTGAKLQERMATLSELNDAVPERMAALVILGPKSVSDAYVAVIDALTPLETLDVRKINAAESALSEAMRVALAVKDY